MASRNLELIQKHTIEAVPYLCPEIRLRLITDACPLWTATEAEAASSGLVDPYWAFCWAGGQALARYLLDHPKVVRARTVLDFGAGGAVEGIAAARAGGSVTVADIDPLAIDAAHLNANLNGVSVHAITDDLIGRAVDFDVVLAGDVLYDPAMARRVLRWLRSLRSSVLIADPGRGFVPDDLVAVASYDAPSDIDRDGTDLIETTVYALRP